MNGSQKSASGQSGLLTAGFAVALGRFSGILIAFVGNIVLARSLGKEDFGRFSLLSTTILICATFAQFGQDRQLLKSLAGADVKQLHFILIPILKRSGTVAIVTTFASACGMTLLLWKYSSLASHREKGTLILTSVCIMGLSTLLQLVAESFRGLHDLKRATFYDANRSGPLIGILFILFLSVSLQSASAPLTTVLLFQAISVLLILSLATVDFVFFYRKLVGLANVQIRNKNQPVPESRSCLSSSPTLVVSSLSLACSSVSLAAIEGMTILRNFGGTWIASIAATEADVAGWGVTTQLMLLVGMPLTIIEMTIMASIPFLWQKGKPIELQNLLQRSATVAFLFCLPPLLMLLMVPGWVITMAYGSQYADAAAPLAFSAIGRMVFVWTGSCGPLLILTGHQRFVLIITMISMLLMFVGGYFATLHFGLLGLACVNSAVAVFSNLANWVGARVLNGLWTHGTITFGRNMWKSS